ncbi:MAG: hypothetical protein KKG33_07490 [candidate division Zixibacteria bacterium]|nr:hypothetical protein [candidate division Zixibacteria bacterium]MBU1469787.1 hypothetical protein [candidate division Zixibacteria bacterium]MBU2625388.1 hypothetical protein [candidate division Zixibacteria bacterium]
MGQEEFEEDKTSEPDAVRFQKALVSASTPTVKICEDALLSTTVAPVVENDTAMANVTAIP